MDGKKEHSKVRNESWKTLKKEISNRSIRSKKWRGHDGTNTQNERSSKKKGTQIPSKSCIAWTGETLLFKFLEVIQRHLFSLEPSRHPILDYQPKVITA